MSRERLSRRTVLRGALAGLGVAVALPSLEAMLGRRSALGQNAAAPKRLGVWFWGNGVKLDRWVPELTGSDWQLSEELAPLADVKDYVSVVSGMNVLSGNQRGHHSGCTGILSGAPLLAQPHPDSNFRSTFSLPSIDQVAAAELGTTARFRSIEVGVSKKIEKGEGTTTQFLSHNGADSPNPAEYDPVKVFERLFSDSEAEPLIDASTSLRLSVLDAVKQDFTALRARVGTADRQRLDQHFENLRAIERRVSEPAVIRKPPARPAAILDEIAREELVQRNRIMSDLIASALSMDMTRVFSVHFSGAFGNTNYWPVKASSGHHALTHNEAGDQPEVHAVTTFIMEQFAYFLGALRNAPDGMTGQSVLDNVAILASTDVADGKGHTLNDYPILVAGKGGGSLVHPGIHYRSNGENTSNVLLTLLRAAGCTVASVGAGGGLSDTPCTAIEA
jgi:hypothetical protein